MSAQSTRYRLINQRDHALEAAAQMIDRRIAAYERELSRDEAKEPKPRTIASDRACILEANLLARLIRDMKGKRLPRLSLDSKEGSVAGSNPAAPSADQQDRE